MRLFNILKAIITKQSQLQANLGEAAPNVEKTFTIPTNMYSDYGVYLLALGNNYGAGMVAILRVNSSNNTMIITNLTGTSIFSVTAVSKNEFKVKGIDARARDVCITRLAFTTYS